MVGDKTVKNAPAVDAVMTRLEPTQPIDATTEDSDVTLTNIDVCLLYTSDAADE